MINALQAEVGEITQQNRPRHSLMKTVSEADAEANKPLNISIT
ncbi:internal head protein [Escherichia coli]|nr:internal head protein [Escherichia coli]